MDDSKTLCDASKILFEHGYIVFNHGNDFNKFDVVERETSKKISSNLSIVQVEQLSKLI